jgi:hypothetical protein
MRSLEQALYDHELLTLRVIGEWWELDLTGMDKRSAVEALAAALAKLDLQQEMIFLPPEEGAAINDLVAQGGRAAVAAFSRNHGDVRMMGPGRMEREEPWLDPVSATEALWYRGFVYRGFDEAAEEVLEFYYLPVELLAGFPQEESGASIQPELSMRPIDGTPERWREAVSDAVDDLTALLAVAQQMTLQNGKQTDIDRLLLNPDPERRSMLLTLASEMGLVRKSNGRLRPTRAAIVWLKQSRDEQLCALADAWSNSDWNDLCHTPGLQCEGENWHNDPILARTALLDALPRVPGWYLLADLVTTIKQVDPDFQRPDGNYDTWYIRDADNEGYLAGFDAWDDVEGRLIRFLVRSPLFWLGMVEVADAGQLEQTAFRLTELALNWLSGDPPARDELQVPLVVQQDGIILVPQNADRYHRFQVARISEAQRIENGRPFRYRLSPGSLAFAREQGIKSERLLQFLAQASGRALPKSIQRAVERWEERGVEARIESVTVLRVNDESILETLRMNPRTRDYLGESLGDLAVVIKPGLWEEFCAATAQLGLFLETER